jgi:UDP-3-O-[3-hydroxymyristoyl] N-acetylglucosamine deacetylase
MLRKVFSDNQNFSIFELKEKNIPHSFINKTALKSIA